MHLLSSAVSQSAQTTVIALCVSVIVLVLINAVLVISLHRSNIKLTKRKQKTEEIEDKPPESN